MPETMSAEDAAYFCEHVLSCNDKLCGHFGHQWVKTPEGAARLEEAMAAERTPR